MSMAQVSCGFLLQVVEGGGDIANHLPIMSGQEFSFVLGWEEAIRFFRLFVFFLSRVEEPVRRHQCISLVCDFWRNCHSGSMTYDLFQNGHDWDGKGIYTTIERRCSGKEDD